MSYRHRDAVLARRPTLRRLGLHAYLVLESFADHANEATGLAWIGAKRVAKETGISVRDAQNARDDLIEAGYLVETEKRKNARCFFVLPGLDDDTDPESRRRPRVGRTGPRSTDESTDESTDQSTDESTDESTDQSTDESTERNSPRPAETVHNQNQNRTELQPEPDVEAAGRLVTLCSDHDLERRPPKVVKDSERLRASIERDYTPIISKLFRLRRLRGLEPPKPETELELDAIDWAFATRNRLELAAEVVERLLPPIPLPDCPRCDNLRRIEVTDPNDPPGAEPRVGPCPCTYRTETP